eukprot:TRINITY_DN3651_c0_g2_i1.p1 TRINITY_DN3651_c0_g2~~TRINITY_DN3651_c0_g2_i1.p1  ORF type:complete len:296 (-),score=72.65 TRINITY_DN3651_c0_g2_i1:43-930(-)
MLHVQTPLSKPFSDVRIKEEELQENLISPPAPDWIGTAGEDQSLDIDPELMDSLQRTTKRAKRNRKGESVTKSATAKRENKSQATSSTSLNQVPDVEMKDEVTPDEEDPTMPPQGPAFDFSQLQPGQTLSREQLLVFSTEDFDLYMAHLKTSREVTPEENAELKTIRRRIRNRESARESRSNKKEYVDRLQTRVETLKTHNKQLSLQIYGMQSENQSLKEEVIYLQDMIKKTPALENLFNAFLYISTNAQAAMDTPALTSSIAPASAGGIMSAGSTSTVQAPINVNSFLDSSTNE